MGSCGVGRDVVMCGGVGQVGWGGVEWGGVERVWGGVK